MLVPRGTGYAEIADRVAAGDILVNGYKIIIIMTGRRDVLDRSASVPSRVQRVSDALQRIDPALMVVFMTPIPWFTDEARLARKIFRTGALLRSMAKNQVNLHFSKATEDLTVLGGINSAMMSAEGINEVGRNVIRRLLLGKIHNSKLRQKYAQVKQAILNQQHGRVVLM